MVTSGFYDLLHILLVEDSPADVMMTGEALGHCKAQSPLHRVVDGVEEVQCAMARSYGLHANFYMTKLVDFTKFVEVIRSINEFWRGAVTLPFIRS
jgi:hypothetical protein